MTGVSPHVLQPTGWRFLTDTAAVCLNATQGYLERYGKPLAFNYGYRSLKYQVFDKLECVYQGQIIDEKRLGAVLKQA